MTRTCATALLIGIAVLVATAPPAQAQAQDGEPVVLSEGHVDVFDLSFENDVHRLEIKDDTQPGETVRRDPGEVILQALPGSQGSVPELADYAFLGEPGDPVWILPQIQNVDLLWPGWNSERLDMAEFPAGVELALTEFDGPGGLKLYIENFLGLPDEIPVDTDDPQNPDTWTTSVPTHAHANWAFTAEGTYTLTVQARATLADSTQVESDDIDYTFVVGDLPAPDEATQEVVTTIDEMDGALVISVDPDDRTVQLPGLELTVDGASLETTGQLRPVTVTDTRPGAPGWTASAQAADFTGDTGTFTGSHLGWAPEVLAQADGQHIQPGQAVPAGFPTGDGLALSRTLASAAPGDGRGTAQLGADLELRVPTSTTPGTYRATLTFTAI